MNDAPIPSDIRERAEAIKGACYDRLERWEGEPFTFDALVGEIAAALMAERERCAIIADLAPDEPFARHGQWHGTLRASIVAAIRKGSS